MGVFLVRAHRFPPSKPSSHFTTPSGVISCVSSPSYRTVQSPSPSHATSNAGKASTSSCVAIASFLDRASATATRSFSACAATLSHAGVSIASEKNTTHARSEPHPPLRNDARLSGLRRFWTRTGS